LDGHLTTETIGVRTTASIQVLAARRQETIPTQSNPYDVFLVIQSHARGVGATIEQGPTPRRGPLYNTRAARDRRAVSGALESPASTYGVELLLDEPPRADLGAMEAAIRVARPRATRLTSNPAPGVLHLAHPDLPVRLGELRVPAQTVISTVDVARIAGGPALEAALAQSWSFPGARATVARARHALVVTDLMSSTLAAPARLRLAQQLTRALTALLRPIAIHWRPAQRVIPPDALLDANGDEAAFFAAGVNVRLFRVAPRVRSPDEAEDRASEDRGADEDDGSIVMDTFGLGALGLTDLQCHARGLEPDALARLLYNTAWYVFERGDVLEHDHTVEGLTPGSRWRCRREPAIVGPARAVIDLMPDVPWNVGRH
jgi:hypothetical protein